MSVVRQSHIEPGAGCSVDVGTGSAGRGGSAEAENVSADMMTELRARSSCLGGMSVQKYLEHRDLYREKVRCATIACHQQTRVVLSQSVYRSEEAA